jgi:hypothetical protein
MSTIVDNTCMLFSHLTNTSAYTVDLYELHTLGGKAFRYYRRDSARFDNLSMLSASSSADPTTA